MRIIKMIFSFCSDFIRAVCGALFGHGSHSKDRYDTTALIEALKEEPPYQPWMASHEIKTFIDPIFNKEVKIDMTDHKVVKENPND